MSRPTHFDHMRMNRAAREDTAERRRYVLQQIDRAELETVRDMRAKDREREREHSQMLAAAPAGPHLVVEQPRHFIAPGHVSLASRLAGDRGPFSWVGGMFNWGWW